MSRRLWDNLPADYRASDDPQESFTLWRGDRMGQEATGINCSLGKADAEEVVYKSLFIKYPSLKTVVKRHCLDSFSSPLISLTSDVNVASEFATYYNSCIYEVTLPASRLIADPIRGYIDMEFLAIGRIEPADITAILLNHLGVMDLTTAQWDRSESWNTPKS